MRNPKIAKRFWEFGNSISKEQEAVEMSVKKEVSIIEFRDNGKRFKVTKRIPDFSISETKLFDSKEEALKQFNEWLE